MKITSTRLVSLFHAGWRPAIATGQVSIVRLFAALLLLGLGLAGFTSRLAAQVPERFSFQGYMEDGNGQPLGPTTPQNYAVVFRIFPTPSGGTAVWAERQTVTFDKGNYSVILGQGSQNAPDPHGDLSAVVITATSGELYVQSTVTINGSDATVLPRLRLLPSTYSFLAKKALSVDGSGISSGTIADDRLSLGLRTYITNSPIADSRLSSTLLNTINNGTIADSRLSSTLLATITNGPIADSRISFALRNAITNGPVPDASLSANVARRNTANTFTGDQTINGNATINGDLRLGQLSLVAGSSAFRIVTGTLPNLNGSPQNSASTSGTGWTAQQVTGTAGSSFWRVTFNPTFTTPPFIVATWTVNSSAAVQNDNSSPLVTQSGGTSFQVYAGTTGGGLNFDTTFIAIGPR